MISALIYGLISAAAIGLLSIVGIFLLLISIKGFEKMLYYVVGFAAGALIGGAFLHLIPEALQEKSSAVLIFVLFGFSLFFIIEKVLKWRHCHDEKCLRHTFTYMSLIGDGVHNFIDGLIIAGSFIIDTNFGIITSIVIFLHEVPQEVGDFGVLIYGGFTKAKALLYNLLSALTSLVGVVVGYFLISFASGINNFLLLFAAGGFIYIAASDLVPELHKEINTKKSAVAFLLFLLGIVFMYVMKMFLGGV